MKKKKILVTGVAGFIGFSLARKILRKKDVQIIGIDNLNSYYSKKLKLKRLDILKKNKNFKFLKIDLADKKKLENIFRIRKFNCVINLSTFVKQN